MQSSDTSDGLLSDTAMKDEGSESHGVCIPVLPTCPKSQSSPFCIAIEIQQCLCELSSLNSQPALLIYAATLQATPVSDTTAVDHLGASRSALDKQAVQAQSETSSGSIKQSLHASHHDPVKDVVHDAASVPAISAAEAAKTRQTRARKVAVIDTAPPEPPARRRTSVLKERQRERAASEQTDEDFVLHNSRAKPKGKGKTATQKPASKKQAAAVAASDRMKAAKVTLPPIMEDSPEPPEAMDVLLGCTKCRYLKGGCGACRDKPSLERPKSLRWKPDASRQQKVRN